MKPNKLEDSLGYSMDGHLKGKIEDSPNKLANSSFLVHQWRLNRAIITKEDFPLANEIVESFEVVKEQKENHIEENNIQAKFQSELSSLKEVLKNVVEEQFELLSQAKQLENRIEALERQKEGIEVHRRQSKEKSVVSKESCLKLAGEKNKKIEEGMKVCSEEKSKQFEKFGEEESMKREEVDMNLFEFKLCVFEDENLEEEVSRVEKTIKKSFKEQSNLPKLKNYKEIEPFSPNLDNKLENIRLPELPKPEELPFSSFFKKERSEMSLLNELKMCVEGQEKMEYLEINEVGEFEVKGKIEKTEDFKSSYEAILGVVILGGTYMIWTKSGLMKLKFASSELHSNFLKHVNKGPN